MRNELNHIEEIENYLEGRLSAQDKAAFENRMRTSDSLREEVNIQRQIADRIRTNAFKSELAAFHLAYMAVPAKKFVWKTILLNSLVGLACLGSATAAVIYVTTRNNSTAAETKQVAQTLPAEKINTPVEVVPAVEPEKEEESAETKIQAKIWPSGSQIVGPVELDLSNLVSKIQKIDAVDNRYTEMAPVFTRWQFDAEKGTDTIVMAGSNSFVHFPGGILVDKNGNKVKGEVEFRYREFNDAAQMAFSKTSSTWNDNGTKYDLQAAGMFEVRIYKDNEEVFVQDGKLFKIDYNLKKDNADSTYFLAMNKNQQWEKVKKVELKKQTSELVTKPTKFVLKDRKGKGEALGKILVKIYDAQTGVVIDWAKAGVAGTPTPWYATTKADSSYRPLVEKPGTVDLEIKARGYKKMRVNGVKVVQNKVTIVKVNLLSRKRNNYVWHKANEMYAGMDTCKVRYTFDGDAATNTTVLVESKDKVAVSEKELKKAKHKKSKTNAGLTASSAKYKPTRIHLFKTGASYIIQDSVRNAYGSAGKGKKKGKDKGYTTVGNWTVAYEPRKNENSGNVKDGLKCTSTGTYYCAKVTPSTEMLRMKATYLDESGAMIQNAKSICVIDRKKGNAMALNLNEVVKSKDAKIVLLLTSDNKLYGMDEEEYKKAMNVKTGEWALKLKRINISRYDELNRMFNLNPTVN